MHIYYFSVLLSRGLTWVSLGYQEGISWQEYVPPGDWGNNPLPTLSQLLEEACLPPLAGGPFLQ